MNRYTEDLLGWWDRLVSSSTLYKRGSVGQVRITNDSLFDSLGPSLKILTTTKSPPRHIESTHLIMKVLIVIAFLTVVAVYAKPSSRQKRQAYDLPDGSQFLLGPVRTTFQCRQDGYYADVDNNCQIFHICNTANHADGTSEIQHYSFFCGNQTVFDQLSFTCAYPDSAIPCQNAPDFFYLNGKLGVENAFFHDDGDIQRAAPLLAANRGVPARG